jgi:hypothetical protein
MVDRTAAIACARKYTILMMSFFWLSLRYAVVVDVFGIVKDYDNTSQKGLEECLTPVFRQVA